MSKQPDEIAQSLAKIFEREFGGKARGKYRISRTRLRILSQLGEYEQLDDTAIEKIIAAACKKGYIVVPVQNYYVVTEGKLLMNLRPVTKAVLDDFIENSEIYDSGTDDDD